MERLEAVVSGRVQLVLYRDFVCRHARALGLVGEVENLPDGTVRVVAEGPRSKLDELVIRLWKGSAFSKVEMVKTEFSIASKSYSQFRIVYQKHGK